MSGDKIEQNTTYKVRLYPTPAQAALFDKTFACCRWMWNAILADEREFFAATGEHFLPTPATYKKEAPFLKEVDSQALVTVHQNLRRAFQDFFSGKSGYPKFKQPYSRDAYTVYCHHYEKWPDSIYVTENAIRLPKAGLVRAEMHRRPLHWWTLKAATVSKSRGGNYYCSILFGYDAEPPEPIAPEHIGTVEDAGTPEHIRKAEAKLKAMEQKLKRMTPGSENYKEQKRRIDKQREHIANQKQDHFHKESRRLADEHDAFRVSGTEDAQLRENLRYKLARQGKRLIED